MYANFLDAFATPGWGATMSKAGNKWLLKWKSSYAYETTVNGIITQ